MATTSSVVASKHWDGEHGIREVHCREREGGSRCCEKLVEIEIGLNIAILILRFSNCITYHTGECGIIFLIAPPPSHEPSIMKFSFLPLKIFTESRDVLYKATNSHLIFNHFLHGTHSYRMANTKIVFA